MLELTVVGNLGADPEARYTQDGKLVCNFDLAANRKIKGEEVTTWVRVAAWGDLGEACHKYLKKGSKVLVRGYPEVEAYQRKDGSPGAAIRVTASTVEFL